MTMRAIGYLRVSTGVQVESGLGLEAQLSAVRDAAKRLGAELVAVFRDEGLSGALALADRPGLLDAVAELGRGDVLLVAARSRLGRDVVNVALVEREVANRGARIVSAAGEGSELEGPTADLVKTILDAVASFERAQTALRTRLALRAKRARGERAGNVPWGYRANAEGRLEEDPTERATITLVRDLDRQGFSRREIVAELASRGVVGRTRRPLGLVQVHRMLRAAA